MTLSSPLTDVNGVGPALAKKFATLGLHTAWDIIDYLPRRYENYSVVTPVAKLKPGPVTIEGAIGQVKGRYVRRGMHITEAVASDATGSVRLVWFNQPYRAAQLKGGQAYFISGTYELSHQRFAIMSPTVEAGSDFPINTARIVPIYRETKGLASRQIRQVLRELVPLMRELPETLPAWLLKRVRLMPRAAAVEALHFPASSEDLAAARTRFGFEEVFRLSLASLLNRQEAQTEMSLSVPFQKELAQQFVGHLPFRLTDAQRKVVWRIYQDLEQEHPMNRLVEGDVGSGKTVVAAMAALMVLKRGYQAALMAPTELLARQHAATIHRLLEPLGLSNQVVLLVGGMTATQKKQAQAAIAAGQAGFIVGTHALIQEKVDMHRLALVIIDEQHRFGVEQRKTLMGKAGHMPHVLSLTATPIPRSLALTLYGELDISVLNMKPAGRQPVLTAIVSPNSRAQVYEKVDAELAAGRQMFVVCPLIEESDASDLQAAETVYEQLRTGYFKHRRIGLLHGRMKAADKQSVMRQFIDRQLDILVSTTVIEVGVDVPNATIMLLEDAERFGLAQVHQLRGRVGRGGHRGYCYLMLSESKAASRRLRALESSDDGFRLAEMDLELRGPGAIYGTVQHGQLDLRVAKLTDSALITAARTAAQEFLDKGEDLVKYTELAAQVAKLRAVTNLN